MTFLGCHFFDTHRTELYNVKLEQKTLYIYIKNYFSSINSKTNFQKFLKRFIEFCYFVDVLTYVTLSLKSIYQIFAYICSICRQK